MQVMGLQPSGIVPLEFRLILVTRGIEGAS